MKLDFLIVVLVICLFSNCKSQKPTEEFNFIEHLEVAENSRNINKIVALFSDSAVLYTPDIMPVTGVEEITALYEFVFARNDIKNVTYKVDSTRKIDQKVFQYGMMSTKNKDQNITTQPFKVVFANQNEEDKITEISFGDENRILKSLPIIPAPTGPYKIGIKTYFYDKKMSGNNRTLSFQIWYPSHDSSSQRTPFRSKKVIKAETAFLGMPSFVLSYLSDIKSNSIHNAKAIKGKSFPILLYNHGYGGYSQVYQLIFEELASHGYVIVSIGHENESSLLIKENGDVIVNSPENPFYAKRGPELNGRDIGQWQSQILNGTEVAENDKAYHEMLKLTPLHNESTRLWASDTKAAIDKLVELNSSDKGLHDILDLEKIGVFGHSLGGATAGQMCFGNTIIKAGINLDGFQFGDLHKNKLSVPFMFVSSNAEGNQYLRALTFLEKSDSDAYQVSIEGFSHDNFTDLKFITEGDVNAIELQRSVIKSFFDKYLKGLDINLKDLQKDHPVLSIISNN